MQVSKLNGQNHKQVAIDFVMLWLSLVLVNVVRNYAGTGSSHPLNLYWGHSVGTYSLYLDENAFLPPFNTVLNH